MGDLTLDPAETVRRAREWLAQHHLPQPFVDWPDAYGLIRDLLRLVTLSEEEHNVVELLRMALPSRDDSSEVTSERKLIRLIDAHLAPPAEER